MDKQIKKREQQGSSLLEVLIALVILAAGLFGLAALQVYSLKNINNAQFHTLATDYAYDMAERMRSNRDGLENGGYDSITATVSDPNCSPCTSTQIAQQDGFNWNQIIQSSVDLGGLPSGQGTVTKVGSVYNITVSWKEQQRSNTGGSVGDTSFTLTVQI